ncbi:MAG: RNA-binding S4 domain-containing protein [Tissierellia bacterium]|nr:RNA-binding S4 domain-containing protein [Tissierellia bacterium]
MKIQGEYIQLDRFLKKLNWVDSGGVAKFIIQDGAIRVNGEVERRRGRKLRPGDVVTFDGERAVVE